jgi:hypothetical protein
MQADVETMLAQPPALERIATTPVLASERPAGFPKVKITRLAADRRIHTLGGVRIDFSNSHASESASYALMRTHAAARRLAHREAATKTGGLFHTRASCSRTICGRSDGHDEGQGKDLPCSRPLSPPPQ